MRGLIFKGPMILALAAGRKTQTRRPIKELLVRLPEDVHSDTINGFSPGPPVVARAGVHRARMNPQGAVFAELANGVTLGLKPGEFHFIPKTLGLDALRSTTHLADIGGGKKRWTIIPPGGTKLYAKEDLVRCHDGAAYRADLVIAPGIHWEWSKPTLSSMHMPAAAARFVLELSEIHVEQLQAISREDAIAEGSFFTDYGKHDHQISADGGKTWGIVQTQRAGWSMVKTERDEQCLGSPQTAFGNFYNRVHAGDRWNLKPGLAPWDENPWVFAYVFSVTNLLEQR
jgi:hypothetical protein